MKIGFNFSKYIENNVVEAWKHLSPDTAAPFTVKDESDYTLVCHDQLIHLLVGYVHKPHIQLFIDKEYEKPIIVVNKQWYNTVPMWVTEFFINHELGRITEGGIYLKGKKLRLYCDKCADLITGKGHDSLLWMNTNYPGYIAPHRIKPFLYSDDEITTSYWLAKLFIRK